MEREETQTSTAVLTKKTIRELSLKIHGTEYVGSCDSDISWFIAEDGNGNKVRVTVEKRSPGTLVDDVYTDGFFENLPELPHLLLPVSSIVDDDYQYRCYPFINKTVTEKLEVVLFKMNIPFSQRLILSLSLATAFSEIEEIIETLHPDHFDIDAFLVDLNRNRVFVDYEVLRRKDEKESVKEKYDRLSRRGLMPPEWYENQKEFGCTIPMLRHILAVCIFRILCASDPFDGDQTLNDHPYRSADTDRKMYGASPLYILDENSPNHASYIIGARAYSIFQRIAPRLKLIFTRSFVEGLKNSRERPSASEWVQNQQKMVSWFVVYNNEWRIPDLIQGPGVVNGLWYLMTDKAIIPLFAEKPLYEFMFASSTPCEVEKVVGKVGMEKGKCKILWSDPLKGSSVIYQEGLIKLPDHETGKITLAPWKEYERRN